MYMTIIMKESNYLFTHNIIYVKKHMTLPSYLAHHTQNTTLIILQHRQLIPLRHSRPGIDTVQNSHSHPPTQMHLQMTMQQERPGVNNLMPNRQPTGPCIRSRRDKGIPDLRIAQVETLRDVFHRFSDGGVIKGSFSLADDEEFVGVFVDGMRWLDGC